MNAEKKIAVVTGASRGIGRAIALELAAKGAFVVINYNGSKEKAEAVKAEIIAAGGEISQCNVSDFDACGAFIKETVKKYGQIDILVNNAGITKDGLLMAMSEDDFCGVIDTNLKGTFNCIRHVARQMLKQKSGRIINISSVWGNVGASMEVAYSASKGGVNSFTKALAKELAPSNIQVNAISCGIIDTAMNHCFSPEEMDALRQEIPADRLGQPEEVAKLVLQLIQAPTYLTGQILTLDGGWQ